MMGRECENVRLRTPIAAEPLPALLTSTYSLLTILRLTEKAAHARDSLMSDV